MILEPLKKRKIFLIMAFFGFAMSYLLRHVVQMALLLYGFMDPKTKTEMEEKALVKFYYGYFALQIVCGRLTELFGGKTLVGFGILGASIASLFIPYAIKIGGYDSLGIINGFLGGFLSVYNSAVFNLATKWIPLEERGKLISSMSSYSLGNAFIILALQLQHFLHNEILFIIPGFFGIIWTLCWYMLVYDSPLTHPSITRQERFYIVRKKESEGTTYNKTFDCPWFEIWCDPYVWILFTTHTCYWIGATFLTSRFTLYLIETFDLSPLEDPFLMLPFILSFFTSFLSGYLFDFLHRIGVPLTMLQKIFTIFGTILPACAFVGFIYFRDNETWTLFFYFLAIPSSSWVAGGYYTSFLDIAPNFAATLTAISATVASIGLIMITKIMIALDKGLERKEQWENRFSLVSALLFTSATMFTLFGNSNNVAEWNIPAVYEDEVFK